MEAQGTYLRQITVRKTKAQVTKPDGSSHTCVLGDYETLMVRAMIHPSGEIEDYEPTMTLAVRHPIGYVLEDGTKIVFEEHNRV